MIQIYEKYRNDKKKFHDTQNIQIKELQEEIRTLKVEIEKVLIIYISNECTIYTYFTAILIFWSHLNFSG